MGGRAATLRSARQLRVLAHRALHRPASGGPGGALAAPWFFVIRAVVIRAVVIRAVFIRAVFIRAVVIRAVVIRAVVIRAVVIRAVVIRTVVGRTAGPGTRINPGAGSRTDRRPGRWRTVVVLSTILVEVPMTVVPFALSLLVVVAPGSAAAAASVGDRSGLGADDLPTAAPGAPAATVAVVAAGDEDDAGAGGDGSPGATGATGATGASPATEPRLTLRFADHLFFDGDYYRAISEYRRFLFLTQGAGVDAARAAMAIGEALLRGEQWDAAGRQFDGVATRTEDLVLRRGALFGAARAYLEDGRPELAKPRFRLISSDDDADPALRRQSRWLLAWGHFDAGELDQARELFDAMAHGDGPWAADARAVVTAIDRKGELPLKDPLVAALVSVVPGGGHFYLGQWATGFTSLAWNTLFIVAAVSAWLSGDWGLAAVLTFAELGWYSGSMFGAIAGAYRHNRDAVRNWRDELLATHGVSRMLPELHTVADAPPGSLVRLRGSF